MKLDDALEASGVNACNSLGCFDVVVTRSRDSAFVREVKRGDRRLLVQVEWKYIPDEAS